MLNDRKWAQLSVIKSQDDSGGLLLYIWMYKENKYKRWLWVGVFGSFHRFVDVLSPIVARCAPRVYTQQGDMQFMWFYCVLHRSRQYSTAFLEVLCSEVGIKYTTCVYSLQQNCGQLIYFIDV